MDPNSLLLIAENSSANFNQKQTEYDKNNNTVNSQIEIIGDLTFTYQNTEKTIKKLAKIDEEIASIDEQMKQATEFLDNLLRREVKKRPQNECSDFIKMIINTQMENLNDIIKDGLKTGPNISILTLIEFENQLASLIQSMKDQKMLPVFDKQKEVQRNEVVKAHNDKLLNFMNLLKQSGYK